MNPGPVEEGSKVAQSLIGALASQPVILSLVAFNIVFLVLVYLGNKDVRANQGDIIKVLIDNNTKATEMLSRCVVPH